MKKKSKFKFFFIYLFIILIFDFSFTNFFFKKTVFWKNINKNLFLEKKWRIKSSLYHHDLQKNIKADETWGHLKYTLITNSLGFRDFDNNEIKLENSKKKRIYINGDSFIEGVGYNYEDTVIGLIQKKHSNNFEILNSAVTSYSPSIYYTKTKYFLEKGLKIDHCIIFLDISDIPDENFINEDDIGNIFDIREKNNQKSLKGKIYNVSNFYVNNFVSGKLIYIIREITGNLKTKIKKKILASKKFNKSIFKITVKDTNLYKSTHIDRSMWTYSKKYSDKWEKKGLKKSEFYLNKLFDLLKKNNINSYLVIYPNPGQILFNEKNVHEQHWIKWANNNNINLINLYDLFNGEDKKNIIEKYFIEGDVHWNKKGNLLVFNRINKEIIAFK